MGGDLTATSELHQGSEFKLTLPLEQSDMSVAAGGTETKRRDSLKRDYQNARVLLVEDNRVNQKVATRILSRMGLDVVVAENGKEALTLATDDIELVLMDIQMPVMDGLQATEALLERGWTKPIVALSANVFPEDQLRYVEVGMSGFIAKPLQVSELVSLLDGYLGACCT